MQGALPASSKFSGLHAIGWHRIAVCQTPSTCNSVNISLKRHYNVVDNEYHNILLMSVYQKSKFVLIGNLIDVQLITKIRHTKDAINACEYLEIYYSSNLHNALRVILYDTEDVMGNKWVTITPVVTDETVDGVTVISSMDLTTT